MSELSKSQIKEFGKVITGFTPPTSNQKLWDGEIPFYSPSDFNDNVYCLNTERKVKPEALSNDRIVQENSLMVTCIASIGKIALAKYRGISNQQINTIVFNEDFDFKYCFYLIKNNTNELIRLSASTAVPILNKADFENIYLYHHSNITEQRRIAQILTTTDAVIEKTQAAIAKYKAIKQGMLHDLFTRGIDPATNKLRPSYKEVPELYKESKLGWIPKEWDCDEFQNVCSFITDGSHFSPTPIDDGEIIVNVKDLGEFVINYESCTRISKQEFEFLKKQNCSPKKGDVLLSKDGTIGKVILFNEDLEIVILSSIAIIRSSELIKSNYLYCFLKSEYFDYQLLVKISGSALKRIVLRDINLLLICFSKDLVEQEMISKRILSIESKLQSEQTYLQKLQQIKKGLMEDLLSGKKRVKVETETDQ